MKSTGNDKKGQDDEEEEGEENKKKNDSEEAMKGNTIISSEENVSMSKEADGKAVNSRLLKKVDSETVQNIQLKQMEIVGAEDGTFLDRIDLSLQEGRLEPFFLKEQWDLFAWREKFFHDNFPPGTWFTDDEDEDSEYVTVPMQVTQNFSEVMALASSNIEKKEIEKNYFASDKTISESARERFDRLHVRENFGTNYLGKTFLIREKITFGMVASMIVEFHTCGRTLVYGNRQKEEIDDLKDKIKLGKNIPEDLKGKSLGGFFNMKDETPGFLTDEGKKLFLKLQELFKEIIIKSGKDKH